MLREACSVISFLTILPSPSSTLENTARYMWLFPMVGILVGLLAGSIGLGLSEFMDPLLVSLFVVAFLTLITGFHHADGLADFADGLMVRGTRKKKLEAMKDVSTGSAGIVCIVLCMAGLIITLSLTDRIDLFRGIIIAEILAKFSMVLIAGLGRSASTGSGSVFVGVMQDRKRLVAASAVMIVPVVLIGGTIGLMMLGTTIALVLFVLVLSAYNFGGITGDVMGATNELVRLSSLVVFVTI